MLIVNCYKITLELPVGFLFYKHVIALYSETDPVL